MYTHPQTTENWLNPKPIVVVEPYDAKLPCSTIAVDFARSTLPVSLSSTSALPTSVVFGSMVSAVEFVETPDLMRKNKWHDQEYRQGYVEAAVEQGVAWQIRANREARDMTQTHLAKQLNTHQSAISRLEDPTYGNASLDTLVQIAHAFDCALSVKFVSFSELAAGSERLSDSALIAQSFAHETSYFGASK